MPEDDADDLVAFRQVRVIETTAQALFCAIDGQRVWLPRNHIKGRLICRGDCGPLLIRRWVALDRHLTGEQRRDEIPTVEPSVMRGALPGRLRLLPSRHKAPLGQ
jgi:hypothetical protein